MRIYKCVLAWVIGAMWVCAGSEARAGERFEPRAAGSEAREATSEATNALRAEPTLCARCLSGCMRGERRWLPWDCESWCAILLCRPERRVVSGRPMPLPE